MFVYNVSMAVLTDADFILGGLDSSLFPGLSSDIKVHSGFRNEQSLYALLVVVHLLCESDPLHFHATGRLRTFFLLFKRPYPSMERTL